MVVEVTYDSRRKIVSSTWFSAESNLGGKENKDQGQLQQTERHLGGIWKFKPVCSLVDMKPQRLQLLLLCSGDHLLHFRQLLGFSPAGLQRRQDGLNSLGLLQQTPGSQGAKSITVNDSESGKKMIIFNNLVDNGWRGYKRRGNAVVVDSLALFGLKQAPLYEVGHRLDKELTKARNSVRNINMPLHLLL